MRADHGKRGTGPASTTRIPTPPDSAHALFGHDRTDISGWARPESTLSTRRPRSIPTERCAEPAFWRLPTAHFHRGESTATSINTVATTRPGRQMRIVATPSSRWSAISHAPRHLAEPTIYAALTNVTVQLQLRLHRAAGDPQPAGQQTTATTTAQRINTSKQRQSHG